MTPLSPSPPKNRSTGFTLIEIISASAIASLLLLMLLQVFNSATESWSGFHRQVDVDREARAALHIIAEDISSIYTGSSLNLPVEIDWDEASTSGAKPGDGRYHSNELIFVTSKTTDAQNSDLSDLCITGYYLAVTADPQSASASAATPRYSQNLYRYYRTSDEAFDSSGSTPPDATDFDPLAPDLLDFITAANPIAGITAPSPLLLGPEATINGTVGRGLMNAADEPLAFNVVQFRAIPYFNDNSGANPAITTTSDELWPQGGPATPDPNNTSPLRPSHPAYIDLILRVTSNETANKLEDSNNPDDWRGLGILKELLVGSAITPANHTDDPEVRTYRSRVHLAN